MPEPQKKIPGECKCCGSPLSRSDMERFVDLCEMGGKDPIEEATHSKSEPGIICATCAVRSIVEAAEDPSSPLHKLAKGIISRRRREVLGIRSVKG